MNLRYKPPSPEARETVKEALEEAKKLADIFKEKDERERKKARGKTAGCYKKFSSNGVVSITPHQWQAWLKAFQEDPKWTKTIKTRPAI